eukprot:756931-Hanusia_phi.AAC.1
MGKHWREEERRREEEGGGGRRREEERGGLVRVGMSRRPREGVGLSQGRVDEATIRHSPPHLLKPGAIRGR